MTAPRRALAVAAALAMLSALVACGHGSSSAPTAPPTVHATLPPTDDTTGDTTGDTTPETVAATDPATVPVTDPATVAPTTPASLPTPEPPPDPNAPEPYTVIGTIEIPKLKVTKPLLEGVTLTTLNRGPGHWPGSAMPGHLGNVVVAGHRTSHDRPFRYIDQLLPGDQVIFTTAEGRFVYTVVSNEVVTPDALRILDQTTASTATLFACTPPGSTKFRLVVHLQLAPGA